VITQLLLACLAFTNDYLVNSTTENDGIEVFRSLSEKIRLVLFIAPIFETLVFNLLFNELIFKISENKRITIVISSIFFGLIHFYSIVYVFFTFLAGILFNNYYFKIRDKKGYLLASFLVFLLHFNHNGLGLLLGK
jgi:hypothetical protein